MHLHRVVKCAEILDQKIDEYISTHEEWYKKGFLCPHDGNVMAHAKMDEIMEDVEQAHDMLHIAMKRADHHIDQSKLYPPEKESAPSGPIAPGTRKPY